MKSHESPDLQPKTRDVVDKNGRLEVGVNQNSLRGQIHEKNGCRVLTALGRVQLDCAHRIADKQFIVHCRDLQRSRIPLQCVGPNRVSPGIHTFSKKSAFASCVERQQLATRPIGARLRARIDLILYVPRL